jgi:hypothetical protein
LQVRIKNLASCVVCKSEDDESRMKLRSRCRRRETTWSVEERRVQPDEDFEFEADAGSFTSIRREALIASVGMMAALSPRDM